VLGDKLSDELGTDTFEIDRMFAHRQVVVQILLVDATKGTQKIAGGRPQAFDSVGMDLADAIAVVITRPFFPPVTHSVMRTLDLVVPLPLICVTGRVSLGVAMHVLLQCLAIRMVPHAQATLSTVAPHSPNNGRPIVVVCPVPPLFVGTTPRRIKGSACFSPFFPCVLKHLIRFRVLIRYGRGA
jgi:hypothetical protein